MLSFDLFLFSLPVAEEICERVMKGQTPSFRPTLPNGDIDDACSEEFCNVIKRCWSEDLMERPDFHQLKNIIKRINKYIIVYG